MKSKKRVPVTLVDLAGVNKRVEESEGRVFGAAYLNARTSLVMFWLALFSGSN
jgi:hypothetical protein